MLVAIWLLQSCSTCERKSERSAAAPEGFHDVTVDPPRAKAGDRLEIEFAPAFPPSAAPEVSVDGRNARLRSDLSEGDNRVAYVYAYEVTGKEREGEVEVEVRYADGRGREFSTFRTVVFDFTAPRADGVALFPGSALRLCGNAAGASATATLQFVLSEPAAVPPVVELASRAARSVIVIDRFASAEFDFALDGVSEGGEMKKKSARRGRGSADPGSDPAFHPVRLSLSDEAGNQTIVEENIAAGPPLSVCLSWRRPSAGESFEKGVAMDLTAQPAGAAREIVAFLGGLEVARSSSPTLRRTAQPDTPLLGAQTLSILAFDGEGRWALGRREVRLAAAPAGNSVLGGGTLRAVTDETMNSERGEMSLVVKRLAVDRANGIVWIGTNGGVTRYDGNEFRWYGMDDGLVTDAIDALALEPLKPETLKPETSSVAVWAGGPGGLSVFDGHVWRGLSAHTHPELQQVYALAFETVKPETLKLETSPVLWAGTAAGLVKIDPLTLRIDAVYTTEHGLPHNEILSLAPASHEPRATSHVLWLGTKKGLGRWLPDEERFVQVEGTDHLVVTDLAWQTASSAAFLWVATWGDGLYRHRVEEGEIVFSQRIGGLPDPIVWAVLPEDQTVWVGLNHGGARIDGEEVTPFGLADGLMHPTLRSLALDPWGGRWFGTLGGITRVGG